MPIFNYVVEINPVVLEKTLVIVINRIW